MVIVSVPNVRVLKPIHVHIEQGIGEVHVSNKMCAESSVPLSRKYF